MRPILIATPIQREVEPQLRRTVVADVVTRVARLVRPRRANAGPARRGGLLGVAATLLFLAAGSAVSYADEGGSAPDTAPLVRYVPASARLCVTMRRLQDVDAAMKRARAWRLLPALVRAAGEDNAPFDLRQAVTELFRFTSGKDTDELMRSEVGLIAPSWDRLDNAVWLVRVPNEDVLDRWFPPTRRLGGGAFGAVRLFRTRDGFTVCVREGIAAIGRQWGSGSLLDQTMKLMVESGGDALEASKPFQDLAAYLPSKPLAQVYISRQVDSETPSLVERLWWPRIERAVVGVYEGEGRLDIGVRATLSEPRSKRKLAPSAVQHLLRLPQTTLFASATTVDFEAAVDAGAAGASRGAFADYVAFVAIVQRLVGGPAEEWPKFGPHLLIAWDQDLREKGTTPQGAVMIECEDGLAVRDHMRRMVEKLLGFVRSLDSEDAGGALAITDSRHLGVTVSSVRLDEYARRSSHALAKLFEHVEPAWSVWNGWLIVALGRDHLERILDAQFGLAPTLATVPDVRALGQGAPDRTVVSIVQPGLATRVLGRWLAAHHAGKPSLLDPSWWQDDSADEQVLPGVVLAEEEPPGAVVVDDIDPDSAMATMLAPGDRIVGIDGRLLPLPAPGAALRTALSRESDGARPILRILRGQAMLDMPIPEEVDRSLIAALHIKPAEALAELISLGRTLQFASFAVNMSEDRQYSARFSLRFTIPRKATDAP